MEKIVFSKYSNERARKFAIRTDIVSNELNQRTVFKRNLYPEGQKHIENIYKWYQKLSAAYQGSQIELNHCEYLGDKVTLEYLEQPNLEHELNELLSRQDNEQFHQLLFAYLAEVKKGGSYQPFVKTEAFTETFGDVDFEDAVSAEVTNIDMVLSNVLLGEKWTIIDYEWTFDFPIPFNFVLYRILHYFIAGSPCRTELDEALLFEQAGITDAECDAFAAMERHFQMSYLLREETQEALLVPIREMHEAISPGGINLKNIYADEVSRRHVPIQIFESETEAFSEENSMVTYHRVDQRISLTIALKEKTRALRLDPHEFSCVVSELQIEDENGEVLSFTNTNGHQIEGEQLVFLEDDPQLIFTNLQGKRTLSMNYVVRALTGAEKQTLALLFRENATSKQQITTLEQERNQLHSDNEQYQQQVHHQENQLAYQSQVIANMENTKIWKAYERYKKLVKKT